MSTNFTFFNKIKEFYIEKVISITNFTEKYFNQAKNISILKKENEELLKYKTLYIDQKTQLNEIQKKSSLQTIQESVTLVKALSYVEFDDLTRVWLDLKKEDTKIAGLIYNNFAAGIVVKKDDKALALLNGNEKANYAVFIGENSAPGIIHDYRKSKYIVAKYIPIWIDIKIGDEVITSGMDNIFFKGLKVGKVISINKMADMQEAVIAPYAQVLKERFFYLYETKAEIPKNIKVETQEEKQQPK